MKIEQSDISEILEPLHACLIEVVNGSDKTNALKMKYTDSDVTAATLMFAHVLSNRFVHYMKDQNASVQLAENEALKYATFIKEIALSMSGVDTSKFLKGR